MPEIIQTEYSWLAGTAKFPTEYWFYRGSGNLGPGIYYGSQFVASVPAATAPEQAWSYAKVGVTTEGRQVAVGAGPGGEATAQVQQELAGTVQAQQQRAQYEERLIEAGLNPYPMQSAQYAAAEQRIVSRYGLPQEVQNLGTEPTGYVGPFGSYGNPYNPTAHTEFLTYESAYAKGQERRLEEASPELKKLYSEIFQSNIPKDAGALRPQYQPKLPKGSSSAAEITAMVESTGGRVDAGVKALAAIEGYRSASSDAPMFRSQAEREAWYQMEIANREIAAIANTVKTPVPTGSAVYDKYIKTQYTPEYIGAGGPALDIYKEVSRTGTVNPNVQALARGEAFTPQQAEYIDRALAQGNAAYEINRRAVEQAYIDQPAPAQPHPYPELSFAALVEAPLMAPEMLYGVAQGMQQTIKGASDSLYAMAKPLPLSLQAYANAEIAFGSAFVSTAPFLLSLPYAAKWTASNISPVDIIRGPALLAPGASLLLPPTPITKKGGEIVTGMATEIFEQELKSPGSAVGTAVGMWAGGKAIAGTAGGIRSVSPVVVDIATPISTGVKGEFNLYSTLSTRRPFSSELPTQRLFVAYGADISNVKYGVGSPTEIMKSTRIQTPDIFNVRNPSASITDAQARLLEPFYRSVTRGTPNEPIVASIFDLRRNIPISERTLQYTTEQPVGSSRQTGVSPGIKTAEFEILAKSESRFVGSQALADIVGEKYIFDVKASDVDISMPRSKIESSFSQLKETFEQNKGSRIEPYRVQINEATSDKLGYSFRDVTTGEKPLGVHELFKDVRTFTGYTEKGTPIQIQTPEYAIESKASRLFRSGGKSPATMGYSPDTGAVVVLGGGKTAKDLAAIYVASRKIARTAYTQGYYSLGRTYEGVSLNVKRYAETTGNAELIESIPTDILKGVYKGQHIGAILGTELIGVKPFGENYPTYIRPYERSYPVVTPIGVSRNALPTQAYPRDQIKYSSEIVTGYPTTNPQTELGYPEAAIYKLSQPYPQAYPDTLIQTKNLPVTQDTSYPQSSIKTEGYPSGTASKLSQGITQRNLEYVQVRTVPYVKKYRDESLIVPLKQDIDTITRPWRKQRGKRFVEVLSFNIYKGMKAPERAYVKDFRSFGRFKETLSINFPPAKSPSRKNVKAMTRRQNINYLIKSSRPQQTTVTWFDTGESPPKNNMRFVVK